MFGFNVNISYLYPVKPLNYSSLILSYVSIAFGAEFSASIYGISTVFAQIIIVLM